MASIKLSPKHGVNPSLAVCPICGRQFRKRVNNQLYDRDVCRRAAKKKGKA